MSSYTGQPDKSRKPRREFQFVPRVINPAKIANAVVLSAEQEVRGAGQVIKETMPWVKLSVLSSPASVATYASEEPSIFIFDDTAANLVDPDRIRQNNKDVVLALLSSNPFIQCSPPRIARQRYQYTCKVDLVFAVNGGEFAPGRIITSVLRSAEDLLNIAKYSRSRRYIFLIVDDEPRWFSQFLPVLYGIIGQRADVKITRTYEETLDFLFGVEEEAGIDKENFRSDGHGDDVVCLITDIFFPRGDQPNSLAGIDLIKVTKQYYPRYTVIIASKAKEANDFRDMGFILPKGDPGSLEKLGEYILNLTGMGDFVVYDDDDRERYRVKNIHEMYGLLSFAERDTDEAVELRRLLEIDARNDRFSTWLYMHSFRELGDALRPKQNEGLGLIRTLKRYLRREILRMRCTPLVVDGSKVFDLDDLLQQIQRSEAAKLQPLSDNDILSSWLDRKGYPELAEELRPIHGDIARLRETLVRRVEKWKALYEERTRST